MPNTAIINNKKSSTPNKLIKETFPVLEMTCAACAISVASMLKSAHGVEDAGVNYANQSAWVAYHPELTTKADLQNKVRSIGYDLIIDAENSEEIKETAQRAHYKSVKQ